MSRVEEALRRAAALPALAATRSAAEPDPGEGEAVHGSRAGAQSAVARPVARAGHRADGIVAPRFSKAYQSKLVIDAGVPPASVEQYRRLAATVHHLQAEQGLRRLVVSSAVPREGKTLTIVNLALTLSESYARRVLLIDADLRQPSVHTVFGISNRYGLCDAILSDPMELRATRVSRNLWVLPAGLPDASPTAALASGQMTRLLDEADSSFDWILLDAPPFGVVADAGLLVRLARAAIVVIAAGSTPYALVEKTVAELGREHIVGTVLNRAEGRATPWSAYYGPRDGIDGSPIADENHESLHSADSMGKVEHFRP